MGPPLDLQMSRSWHAPIFGSNSYSTGWILIESVLWTAIGLLFDCILCIVFGKWRNSFAILLWSSQTLWILGNGGISRAILTLLLNYILAGYVFRLGGFLTLGAMFGIVFKLGDRLRGFRYKRDDWEHIKVSNLVFDSWHLLFQLSLGLAASRFMPPWMLRPNELGLRIRWIQIGLFSHGSPWFDISIVLCEILELSAPWVILLVSLVFWCVPEWRESFLRRCGPLEPYLRPLRNAAAWSYKKFACFRAPKYDYQPLQKDQIRLLCLDETHWSGIIYATLKSWPVESLTGEYRHHVFDVVPFAEDKGSGRIISIGLKLLDVSEELFDLLRSRQSPYSQNRVWIRCICVHSLDTLDGGEQANLADELERKVKTTEKKRRPHFINEPPGLAGIIFYSSIAAIRLAAEFLGSPSYSM
jgi:hypothetical protein